MKALAVFDIDGTLTDTNGVDDECYRQAVAEAIGLDAGAIDWSGAAHVTDAEIFRWLCATHGGDLPVDATMAQARSQFVDALTTALHAQPARFTAIAGASAALRRIRNAGWCVASATGGWRPSARLKLRAAGIEMDHEVIACADDAVSRADIVQLAMARAREFYGYSFSRVVSVGDGPWDVQTAAEMKLPFVGIGTGAGAERLRRAGAAIVLADYSDLDGFCEALASAPIPSEPLSS